ncbi:YbaB/EbfC family nucleoid-associated protein [Umezawaea sp.]|uniref:YbaB/EbfC family nucleoid-associated protein n=1 Tax=Umezawaea sp. TaxID=1955258 RepID=UPI002ED60111
MTGWEQQVAENAVRYRRLHERLARTSITESSGDGTVKVTVSASGLITDLVLRERRRPEPLPRIAAEIMDCVRRAQARIPDLLRQAMVDTVGPQDPSTHLLVSEARQRFPQPPGGTSDAPDPVRPRTVHEQRPAARRAVADPDDDWADPVVMDEG